MSSAQITFVIENAIPMLWPKGGNVEEIPMSHSFADRPRQSIFSHDASCGSTTLHLRDGKYLYVKLPQYHGRKELTTARGIFEIHEDEVDQFGDRVIWAAKDQMENLAEIMRGGQ